MKYEAFKRDVNLIDLLNMRLIGKKKKQKNERSWRTKMYIWGFVV